jgi:hypothetical protein
MKTCEAFWGGSLWIGANCSVKSYLGGGARWWIVDIIISAVINYPEKGGSEDPKRHP